MDVSKEISKKKKRKCKAINLSNVNKSQEKNVQKSELASFTTKKIKNKKKNKSLLTSERDSIFSDTNLKFCKKPNHLTSFNSSLLSKKKLDKKTDHKVSLTSENVTLSNSLKKKFSKKQQKTHILNNQNISSRYSGKILKSKRIKFSSSKSNSAKIVKKKDFNRQLTQLDNTKCEDNKSVLSNDMSEESEVSCEEFYQYKNQNNEEDTDEDLEIRKELKSLNVFKQIKKLRKSSPMLFFDTCITRESDSVEMEETVQFSSSDTNSADELITEHSKIISKTSKEFPKSMPSSSKISEKHIKNNQIDRIETYQRENLLHRDYPKKSEKTNRSTNLRNKAQEKLQAAKFRFLNEKLYTENGKDSFSYFKKNNDAFLDYHSGYNLQVLKWPMNPVNKIIHSLQTLHKKLVIADMGCGDAKISQTLTHCVVHSFDLVALNEHVTPCNISKVPLSNDAVDVVVFCLSLMGTNLKDYLLEAFRILKYGGILKIAEVESRIPNLDNFIKSIESLGFLLGNKDIQHKLFVFLDFKKDKKRKKMQDVVLNPCLYKKR